MSNWVPPDHDDPVAAVGRQAIGAAIKAGRLERRSPQRWLAIEAGVSQPVISRLERGQLNGIRWQTLARIVGVLQIGRGLRLPDLFALSNVAEPESRND